MRIITGKFKGRRLKTIKGSEVRPTSDRVKEAIFRIFGERIIDADFLDLCAGTGNIGLEALSRGAKSVTFVDRSYHCIRVIESNLAQCGLHRRHPQVRLINLDARKSLAHLSGRKAKFEVIYCDPPYDSEIHGPCLEQISEARLLAPSGLTVVEHRKIQGLDLPMPLMAGGLTLNRQEQYGDTVLSFYQWEDD